MIEAPNINTMTRKRAFLTRALAESSKREFKLILLFTLLHLPVGLVLYNTGSVGILHPIGVFAVGVYWAVFKNVKLEQIAYLIAYLVGCEVLWRMAQTPIFWEFGKYGSSAIMILALLKRSRYQIPVLPLTFIALLLPACIITLVSSEWSDARGKISFNLSGPFFLFVSCWFFSSLYLTKIQVRRLLLALMIPLLTVAVTTLFYTVAFSDSIQFTTESNFATSGGFGPNQVSSMLGLGAFVGIASLILFRNHQKFKYYYLLAILLLSAQSVMTFSRGGMYNAIGSAVILFLFHLQDLGNSVKRIMPVLIGCVVFLVFIFPFMDNFTGGKLLERFEDTSTTNRYEIIESDLQILAENPVFGAGLGESKQYREKFLGYEAASHTEFSRLISDHGSFGVLSIIALSLMAVLNFVRQRTTFGRALLAGAVFWCCLFMMNAGMRLAAPSFLWGMIFVNIVGFQRAGLMNRASAKNKLNEANI